MALIKLKNPVDKFSEDIRPVCLPFQISEKPLCPDKSYDAGKEKLRWSQLQAALKNKLYLQAHNITIICYEMSWGIK